MHLLRSVITLFCCHSFVAHHAATSLLLPHLTLSSRIVLPVRTMLILHTFRHFLLIAAHQHPLRQCSPFLLACLLLSGDIELTQDLLTLPYVLSISVLSFTHAIQLPCLISLSRIIRICSVLLKLGLKTGTTYNEFIHCTPPNYTFLSTPRISSKSNSSTVVGGGTYWLYYTWTLHSAFYFHAPVFLIWTLLSHPQAASV